MEEAEPEYFKNLKENEERGFYCNVDEAFFKDLDIEIPILELSGFRSDNEMGPISYTIEYGRGEGDLINLHEGTRSYEEKMERYFATTMNGLLFWRLKNYKVLSQMCMI